MEENTQKAKKEKKPAWYMIRIKDLEEQIAELNKVEPGIDDSEGKREAYAMGYFDCLTKYGMLTKTQRRVVRDKMKQHGSIYHRNFKAASRRFR